MKKIGLQMNLLMALSLSFALSLYGNLSSGHFRFPAFLLSFLLSAVISFVIGLLVPMPKLEQKICGKVGADPRSAGGNAVMSLVSDLIYTPVITLAMTGLAYPQAVKHGASVSFGGMFLVSLLISMLIGFVLIFILKPLFLRLVLRMNGLEFGDDPDQKQ